MTCRSRPSLRCCLTAAPRSCAGCRPSSAHAIPCVRPPVSWARCCRARRRTTPTFATACIGWQGNYTPRRPGRSRRHLPQRPRPRATPASSSSRSTARTSVRLPGVRPATWTSPWARSRPPGARPVASPLRYQEPSGRCCPFVRHWPRRVAAGRAGDRHQRRGGDLARTGAKGLGQRDSTGSNRAGAAGGGRHEAGRRQVAGRGRGAGGLGGGGPLARGHLGLGKGRMGIAVSGVVPGALARDLARPIGRVAG